MSQKVTRDDMALLVMRVANHDCQLQEAAGPLLKVEFLMRFIAEQFECVQIKMKKHFEEESRKRSADKNYWECNPHFLVEPIARECDERDLHEEAEKIRRFGKILKKQEAL